MSMLSRLKSIFRRQPAAVDRQYEPYASVIELALSQRGQPGNMAQDPVYRVPVYVVRMCEALATKITEAGKAKVGVQDVLNIERTACGHVDYFNKFAMRCADLAR